MGGMDANLYKEILDDEFMKSLDWYGKDKSDIIFQQDNDPKHTSTTAKQWFKDHGIIVLDWPSYSPDLNPIEHLWSIVKRRLHDFDHPPSSMHELWLRIQQVWNNISIDDCQKLIESMPRRIEAVYKAKGSWTKY